MIKHHTLEQRIARLEARAEIAEIVSAYGIACDDRDVDGLRSLFTEDATVESRDGIMNSYGIDAIMTMYDGRFRVLGPSYHWTHDHIITFNDVDASIASGLILSHVECVRNSQVLLGGLRYNDDYRRVDDRWKFAKRILSFFYYVPATEYVEALGGPLRQRAYGDRRPADFPETLPTWVEGRYA